MADYSIDFSPLGRLPQVIRQAQQDAARQRTLANLGQGDLDYNTAARALLSAGDMQGALTLAQLGRNDRDFQFRQQEAQRAQSNADRQFQFQKDQAGQPTYREVDDGAGGKTLVRVPRDSGPAEKVPIAGADSTPQNPFMTGGAMNESQSKDGLYASRMLNSEKVLREVETSGTDWWQRRMGTLSDKTGVNWRSAEYQKFDQAQRDFINATLRRESGAVISPSEFDNANKQYFPMPGDTKEVIAQKRKNRMEAIKGIGAGAGKGYRPEHTFDPQGNIVPNPAPQRGQQKPQSAPMRFNSPADVQRAVQSGQLKSGDVFQTPDGRMKVVP